MHILGYYIIYYDNAWNMAARKWVFKSRLKIFRTWVELSSGL